MRVRLNIIIGSVAWLAYLLNRFDFKPRSSGGFVDDHLNDFLAPFLLLALAGTISHSHPSQRWLHSFSGVLTVTAGASIVWEIVTPSFLKRSVGDPLDALSYLAGAMVFWLVHQSANPFKATLSVNQDLTM